MGRLYQVNDIAGNTITRFHWDGDELVAEFDGAGNTIRRHLHGAGVDDPITTHEGPSYLYAYMRYNIADRQGSIVALADMDGNVTDRNAYDSYGVPLSPTSASPMVGRFGYTGQAWIPELGLWHYKARFYSPTLGRFMQTDPIGYEDQFNLYAYVGNDPVNNFDSTGLECNSDTETCPESTVRDQLVVAGAAAGAVVGAVLGGTTGGGGGAAAGLACGPGAVACSPAGAVAGATAGAAAGAAGGAVVGGAVGGLIGSVIDGGIALFNENRGGGRNAQKANADRVAAAQDDLAQAQRRLSELKSQPNKTPEVKVEIARAQREVNRATSRLRASENHSMRTKRPR